ncbi:MAG: enoyl-CoA hydratase [Polyangiales bacterium]
MAELEPGATYHQILYQVDEPCAVIALNRPAKLNAWTDVMEREVRHALQTAENDPRVVGIILTGEGRAFCAGADLATLSTIAQGQTVQLGTALQADPGDASFHPGFRHTYSFLASVRKPIIAAINGPCVGMAVPIACFCDLRFASDQASFITAFSRRGLVAEWGSSWILPRLVGAGNAFDLLFSGRKVLADEAARMGLVNRIVPHAELLDEARAYVRMLAENCSPGAIAAMKRQLYHDLLRPLDDSLRESTKLMLESFRSDDFKEGVDAFLGRRPPKFRRLR